MAIEPIGIGIEELERIVDKAMGEIARLLDIAGTTVQQLRQLVLGRSRTSEKTAKVLADAPPPSVEPKPKAKRKGHGRNKACEYTGARRVPVEHATLRAADPCPGHCGGNVYQLDSQQLLRITGHPPLQATNYELAALRCNLCGEVYAAAPPPEAGPDRYDFTAIAMVALLKYGHGVPFHRLERLQRYLGIPLPASVQWELMEECADIFKPLLNQLTLEAAPPTSAPGCTHRPL